MEPHLEERRRRIAAAWDLKDEIVLIGAGEPIPIPGAGDQHYPFRSHPEHFYLTDRECPGGVLAFDPRDGWTDFVPDVTERERVWEGASQSPGTSLSRLGAWVAERRGRSLALLGCELPGFRADAVRGAALREQMTHARRPKDAAEIARIREAVRATAAGYEAARAAIHPGTSERAIAVELDTAFRRSGADGPGYHTIVGSGTNSAVLHFMPTARTVSEGDLVLIDAAAEVMRYCCDVTRTYPGGGSFTPRQRDLYELVLNVEERAVGRCDPGAEYVEVHLQATRETTSGLIALGLLRGNVDTLIEREVTGLFFPHGIGHFVGLGVRDAGGKLPGREPRKDPRYRLQRTDLPLQPGYVITIEPGIYFIPALLENAERRAKLADAVVWSEVDRWIPEGGVRIEDTVHVTPHGPENLTASIPKGI
jgi:Xaa-Pro aminopeptidase